MDIIMTVPSIFSACSRAKFKGVDYKAYPFSFVTGPFNP